VSCGTVEPVHVPRAPGRRRRHGRAGRCGAYARDPDRRAAARAAHRAATIARLVGTPVFAYVLALQVPGSSRPVVAPLTALLVVQVTLYQTIRSAIRRVASVVAGVLVAVALSAAVGFTWWSLGITVAASLVVGNLLHLGPAILEVPISAMMILSVDVRVAATNRIIETLVGAGAGLLSGFILAAPRVQPAEEAVDELCRQMADLLDQMARGLAAGAGLEASGAWLERARALSGEIRRVDSALRQAEESVRLYPLRLLLPGARISLRRTLEIMEHAALTVRGLARAVADSSRLEADHSPLRDTRIQSGLAAVLRELAEAARIYGRLVRTHDTAGVKRLESDLNRHLAAARERQDQLSALLGTDPAARPVGWPLRGELISHLDRLRKELQAGGRIRLPRRRRMRSLRRPAQAGRRPPRSPTRHRVKHEWETK
jgi:uncharacterized membrane protein YgaE (UPF0421/DUF939 family)